MKNIVLLGSTGSVGKNVLAVLKHYPDKFKVKALASNSNTSLLSTQAQEFAPEVVAIGNKDLCEQVKKDVPKETKVLSGAESLEELASLEADIIFICISGTQALKPLVKALSLGRNVALASKEPVVSAGNIIMKLAKENNATIIPVDSEHSAITQCLMGRKKEDIETLYITGTGGSLWEKRDKDFNEFSLNEVLEHPRWDMGRKITIDSATLMNKGLEAIEAHWLFDVEMERIKIVIHPEAVIHSMVEFIDGTIQAGLFHPDMKFPILRALSYPDTIRSSFPRVDFTKLGSFTFFEPDKEKFPALELAFSAIENGGTMPAVLNASNEKAVKMFLDQKIKFSDIVEIVRKVMGKHKVESDPSLEKIIDSEKWATEEVLKFC